MSLLLTLEAAAGMYGIACSFLKQLLWGYQLPTCCQCQAVSAGALACALQSAGFICLMAEPAGPRWSELLPELLADILLPLSFEEKVQAESVCKSWQSVLADPEVCVSSV